MKATNLSGHVKSVQIHCAQNNTLMPLSVWLFFGENSYLQLYKRKTIVFISGSVAEIYRSTGTEISENDGLICEGQNHPFFSFCVP
jgi:hypothetical protein